MQTMTCPTYEETTRLARVLRAAVVDEAVRYGAAIAQGSADRETIATIGYKGITGYEEGSELDAACRSAAQDEAKRLSA